MDEKKRCPYCGEEIMAVAKKCRYCGEWLDPEAKPDKSSLSEKQQDVSQTPSPQIIEDVDGIEESSSVKQQEAPHTENEEEQTTGSLETEITSPVAENRHVKKLYSITIPAVATLLFCIALAVFHFNYRFLDWGKTEEKIINPAVIIFVVLLAVYYLVVFRKSLFSKLKKKNVKGNITSAASTDTKPGFFKKNRKYIGIGVLALLLIGGGIFYVKEKERREEAHKNAVERFESNAESVKAKAKAIRKLSYVIFFDLYKNWRSAIFENRAYNKENKKVYCKNFNDAIHWRLEYYSSEHADWKLVEWDKDIEELIKEMKNPPEERFNEVLDKLTNLYYKADEVVKYCLDPSGNIRSFGDKYENLLSNLDRAIKETDLLVGNNEFEADRLYYDALTESMSTYIDDVLSK